MIPLADPLRILIGAGEQRWDGWIATHREQLDLLDRRTWEAALGERRADAFLCEHVWEHLTEDEGRAAARLCFDFLKPGGLLRCAVPDANFPDPAYQATVQVGGPGPADHPAADHKIVYEHRRFVDVFASAGFDATSRDLGSARAGSPDSSCARSHTREAARRVARGGDADPRRGGGSCARPRATSRCAARPCAGDADHRP